MTTIQMLFKLFVLLGLLNSIPGRRHSSHLNDANSKLLATMRSYMDPNADPCHDFYRYACGNWKNVHRDVSKYVDTVGRLDYVTNQKIKMLLKRKNFKRKAETNLIYHKVKVYYKTCEEQKKFDAKYYLDVIKPMDNVEWPQETAQPWLAKDKWNIWITLGRLQAVGFNGFPMAVDLRHRNATAFQLELDKLETLGYTSYEQELMDVMEASLDVKYRKLAVNIQKFIKQLISLHKTQKEFGSQEMTIMQLQKEIENIDFNSFFSQFLGVDNIQSLTLQVANLKYFRKLQNLILKTSPDVLIHTIKLKFLGYLEKLMPKLEIDFQCLNHMRDLVPLALDYTYEQEIYRYKRNTSDPVIRGIFRNMQHKFSHIIEKHSDEFSVEDILFLQKKIMQMQLNIGNLPLVKNHQFYFHYFRSWTVVEDNFYWNHLNALRHFYKEKYKFLKLKSFSPYHTFFTWPYGSPAYQSSTNILVIPHAYLQFPIFHPKFDDVFLYAELGNALGHEMLHAFDMNGLKYDATGNPSMKLFSSLTDNPNFVRNLQCLQQQRPSSLNERIADFDGFHLAYDAYFEEPLITEFRGNTTLSNKQLFFIKFAQFFCAISPNYISYDTSHDTPFRRVPQVVANHPEFEEVFACPVKAGKHRIKKCELW